MSYRVITKIIRQIQVIGKLWLPPVTAAYDYNLRSSDVENIRAKSPDGKTITREGVQSWLNTHAGDFQTIEDFNVDIEEFESPWSKAESEDTYIDCMCEELEIEA